jgi:hypothetical protein
MADKPGSVVDNHSSGTDVTICLKQPTREPCGSHVMPKHLFLYLVLLLVGFTMPLLLPEARCALTAPFHPYLSFYAQAVYSLLHWPWTCVPQVLPGTLPYGARTFLTLNPYGHQARLSGHLNRLFYRNRFIFAVVSTPCHRLCFS